MLLEHVTKRMVFESIAIFLAMFMNIEGCKKSFSMEKQGSCISAFLFFTNDVVSFNKTAQKEKIRFEKNMSFRFENLPLLFEQKRI
jgi:hypothetical protein